MTLGRQSPVTHVSVVLTCSVTPALAGHSMPPHMGKYSSHTSCATRSDITPIHLYESKGLMLPAVKNAACSGGLGSNG